MFKSALGFTFIELLVVIAIISTVGVLILTTNGNFSEDQKLKQGSFDIQSFIKTALTNATTNVVCAGSNGSQWIVKFSSSTSLDLLCQPLGGGESASLKNLNLASSNLSIISIINSSCSATLPVKVSLDPLNAKMTFADNIAQACIASASNLVVNLKNTKTNNTMTVTINKGGTVDVK